MGPGRLIRLAGTRRLGAAALLLLAVGAYAITRKPAAVPAAPWLLDAEIRVSSGTFAQVYWTAETDFVEAQSTTAPLQPGVDAPQRLRFAIPAGVRRLRLDPTNAPGEVRLTRLILRDGHRVLKEFGPADFTASNHIASLTPDGHGARFVVTGTDPWAVLLVGCVDAADPQGAPLVTRTAALAIGIALVAFVGLCGVAVTRSAFLATEIPDSIQPPGTRRRPAGAAWLWIVSFVLLVFSAKLLLIGAVPLRVPFWDQWDGEAQAVYVPFANCGLSWPQLFNLHNEHRIFFSRLLALDLLLANGHWDPRVQQVANAAVHTFTGLMLVLVLWYGAGRRHLDVIVLAVGLAFALPFAWENTLIGFQSAFYLMLLFAVLGLWLASEFPASNPRWWLGWGCVVCGLFTAAGGILLPPVIGLIAMLRLVRAPGTWRAELPTLAAAAGVLALGYAIASPPLAHHAYLKATTARVFFAALASNLAWPWVAAPLMALFVWVPFAVLMVQVIRRRGATTSQERFLIGLAAWILLQAVAVAYGRGGGSIVPATRYQDFLSLGFVVNAVALAVLVLDRPPPGLQWRRLAYVAAAAWALATGFELDALSRDTLAALPPWRENWEKQAATVRRFLIGGDAADLLARPPTEIPYPDAQQLIGVLQQPEIRRIMPAAVRPPIGLQPDRIGNAAFVAQGAYPITPRDPLTNAWGSYTAAGNPARGTFTSRELPACADYLAIPVAGYLGLPSLSLELREVRSGRLTEVRPWRLAREAYVPVAVACPSEPFVVIGTDQRPDFWFAFGDPVELAWGSMRAEQLIDLGPRLFFAAALLLVGLLRFT